MQKVIQVEGMSCGHCQKAVHDAIAGVAGVSDVQVDLASGEVRFDLPESVPLQDVVQAVEKEGYRVREEW